MYRLNLCFRWAPPSSSATTRRRCSWVKRSPSATLTSSLINSRIYACRNPNHRKEEKQSPPIPCIHRWTSGGYTRRTTRPRPPSGLPRSCPRPNRSRAWARRDSPDLEWSRLCPRDWFMIATQPRPVQFPNQVKERGGNLLKLASASHHPTEPRTEVCGG